MHSIPEHVYEGVRNLLNKVSDNPVTLDGFSFTGGGCINHGGRISTSVGDFFLKWNSAEKFPGMFDAESRGLKLLADAKAIRIPEVIGTGQNGPYQFLLLENITSRPGSNDQWTLLGQQLAALHHHSQELYGLDHENYMGSLQQFNTHNNSWTEFFIHERLNVQLKLGVDTHTISSSYIRKFDLLYAKLPSLIYEETPSLLHGDLWNGNLITDEKGHPCLIDPAVYFGHREVDIAMTQLFGGFGDEFYQVYCDVFPVEPGLQERLDIYNLYPLLVHVNLFGTSYMHQVSRILNEVL